MNLMLAYSPPSSFANFSLKIYQTLLIDKNAKNKLTVPILDHSAS